MPIDPKSSNSRLPANPDPTTAEGAAGELAVTSIRVHPAVMAHVRGLCASAGVNMNQFLIVACCAVESDPAWTAMVQAQAAREATLGNRLATIRRNRDVTPVAPDQPIDADLVELAELAELASPDPAPSRTRRRRN